MLQETEARVARLEASLAQPSDVPASKVIALASLIAAYLRDLRRLLERDTDRARAILTRLVGQITLQPASNGLIAILRGNVAGILDVGALNFDQTGAGSPVFSIPHDLLRSTYRKRLHTRRGNHIEKSSTRVSALPAHL